MPCFLSLVEENEDMYYFNTRWPAPFADRFEPLGALA